MVTGSQKNQNLNLSSVTDEPIINLGEFGLYLGLIEVCAKESFNVVVTLSVKILIETALMYTYVAGISPTERRLKPVFLGPVVIFQKKAMDKLGVATAITQ